MNKEKILMKLFSMFIAMTFIADAHAQCDYVTPRYGVQEELDVFYGTGTLFNGETDSLFLNIYKPVGDLNAQRPLAVWCFGGGFVGGSRQDFDELCHEMAQRGYVAVTIDYRLGYVSPDILPWPFAVDANELPRAAFRAMQDAKGAIRFMKGRHATDSIDLDEVYIGGGSAGAITALAASFLRKGEDIDSIIIGELPPTNTNPRVERPHLGPVEGTLHVGNHDAGVQGVVNIFGALFDVTQIAEDDTIAIYSYHQTGDPVVPCDRNKAYWGYPFVPDNMPFGSGSCAIDDRLMDIDYNPSKFETWIHNGNQHAIHDQDAVLEDAFAFLEQQICDQLTSTQESFEEEPKVSPNPAQTMIRLKGFSQKQKLGVYNLVGQKVGVISEGGDSYNVGHLPNGTYMIKELDGHRSATFIKHH